ncbi:hypothetical protein [Flavilitoribacter nigricans]|nr:hypothetical protein [Flavilitoribacter nigricans]
MDLQPKQPVLNVLYTMLLVVTISYTSYKFYRQVQEDRAKKKPRT